eukprot:TRINITY_DN3634_c0_g1_i1.p1 TRINITY_DN3634_c0_g1~~TRINITY_DN3634_c0_g1_i1.p1  ORF type:complete len:319 (-),score=62.25 TRINITY_DN3634_c0_g1_i1:51-1007(-)
MTKSSMLFVCAHPDDETLYSGFMHAWVHKLGNVLDQVVVTNGEGGFKYSELSEPYYKLALSKESVARENLPQIRKQEQLESAKILGVRKCFFLDQKDLKFDINIEPVLSEQWNVNVVTEQIHDIILTGNGENGYDLVLVMLPASDCHGHHKASAILALKALHQIIQEKKSGLHPHTKIKPASNKIPFVIAGVEYQFANIGDVVNNPRNFQTPFDPHSDWLQKMKENVCKFPFFKVCEDSPAFLFNRKWKISAVGPGVLDYNLVSMWVCSAHKSQGNLHEPERLEQYFCLDIYENEEEKAKQTGWVFQVFPKIEQLCPV